MHVAVTLAPHAPLGQAEQHFLLGSTALLRVENDRRNRGGRVARMKAEAAAEQGLAPVGHQPRLEHIAEVDAGQLATLVNEEATARKHVVDTRASRLEIAHLKQA